MKIYVFVEGPSDVLALNALWDGWLSRLSDAGHGIKVIPLRSKSEYLEKVGHKAAEKLANNPYDLVVGLPDLYPNVEYKGDRSHNDVADLAAIQQRLVKRSLEQYFEWTTKESDRASTERFCAAAFKHDSEMLLLAARAALRSYLNTDHSLGKWTRPVENQNQLKPPKRVVEDLFLQYRKKPYLDTKDAKAVLGRVDDMSQVFLDENRQVQCPVFKGVVDWIVQKTGVRAYELPT